MKSIFALVALLAVALAQDAQIGHCMMRGTSNDPGITGQIIFTQVGDMVQMDVSITGITQFVGEYHGMHVHEFGDLSGANGLSTGTHWNPTGSPHGCENTTVRHYGDTGNWMITPEGTIIANKTLDLLALTGGDSIIGLAVVLHNVTDDCSVTTSAGARLAYCVIGVANPTYHNATTNSASVNRTVTDAICILQSTVNSNITGWVAFSQTSATSPVLITATFYNMVGIHGLHIHQYGDLRLNTGLSAGTHWNPNGSAHGIPPYPVRHAGDLGNIYYYNNSIAYYTFENDYFTVSQILGLAIIVHANQDDCTPPIGNAGSRYAQCVIGIKNPTTNLVIPQDVTATQDITACELLANQTTTGTPVTQATTGTQSSAAATTGSGSGGATTGSGSGQATTGSASVTANATGDEESSSDAFRTVVSFVLLVIPFILAI